MVEKHVEFKRQKNYFLTRFTGYLSYKTLLKSLAVLSEQNLDGQLKIVLDFSDVQSLAVSYSQWANYKSSLNFLTSSLPKNRIAIIGPLTEMWDGFFEYSGNHKVEEAKYNSIHYFHNSQKKAAMKWMKNV